MYCAATAISALNRPWSADGWATEGAVGTFGAHAPATKAPRDAITTTPGATGGGSRHKRLKATSKEAAGGVGGAASAMSGGGRGRPPQ